VARKSLCPYCDKPADEVHPGCEDVYRQAVRQGAIPAFAHILAVRAAHDADPNVGWC
jgi:hypothetical protein